MDLAAIIALNILNGISSLVLLSLGLAIIFGMMRVINLAHGEFLMLGAYTTVFTTNAGLNIWIAMLVVSPLVVGAIGVAVERGIIRFLYGRMVDTMLATWGLSLFIIGLITTIFGNTANGVPAPLGSFGIGDYRASYYSIVLIVIAAALMVAVYFVLRFTRFGLVARATMQNPNMASALGISPPRIYMATFGIGAAISGLAGGVLAPISGIIPVMGAAYIAKAFITVVSGGASILAGTLAASTLFGLINQVATFGTTPVFGEVALFISAIVLLRALPQGITGRFFKGRL
jgi:branched-subunit amino acid ABC-type transport system permease component